MNIFNLKGPEFLALYLLFSILVLFVTYFLIEHSEKNKTFSHVDFTDPYMISTLRNGKQETIRTVVFSLLDRGYLIFQDKKVIQNSNANSQLLRKEIEKKVFTEVASRTYVKNLVENKLLRMAAERYEYELAKASLFPTQQMMAFRNNVCFMSGVILISVSGYKILTALHKGHSNIELLLLLTLFVLSFLFKIYNQKRSAVGSLKLEEIKNLLYRLTARAHQMKPNGTTNEAVLLVSVFGFSVLKEDNFKFLNVFKSPKQNSSSADSLLSFDTDSTTSCGSSCSSCGGGGGCGGCGGGGD